MKLFKIRSRVLGALAVGTTLTIAVPASAAVLYEFTSAYGAFTYSSAQYITSDRTIFAGSLDSCTAVGGTCQAAAFDVDYENRGQNSTIVFSRQQSNFGASSYHYFALGAFAQNGTYATVVDFNPATLRVSGSADPVTPAVPEPATWAMLIIGFGVVGSALRTSRKAKRVFALA